MFATEWMRARTPCWVPTDAKTLVTVTGPGHVALSGVRAPLDPPEPHARHPKVRKAPWALVMALAQEVS
jgi:hypothetical protein